MKRFFELLWQDASYAFRIFRKTPVMAGVAPIAGFIPARRAARTDPMTVLREE